MPKRKLEHTQNNEQVSKKSRLESGHEIISPNSVQSKHHEQSSRLLNLPGEILNMIYKYALTANDAKIRVDIPRDAYKPWLQEETRFPLRHYHPYQTQPEINQLKYVNKRLRAETSALELKFNTLVFQQTARAQLEPDQQLLLFARHSSPAKFAWIETIELQIKALAMPYSRHLQYFLTSAHLDAYTRVARFCRANPQVMVKYILNSFTWWHNYHLAPESRGFINQGIVLHKALRNVDVSALNPGQAGDLLEVGKASCGRRKRKSWEAPNLRFFPGQDEFLEGMFRDGARGVDFEGVEGGVERWIEVARRWAEEGF